MSLLKDFRCILTVPKGGLVRQMHEDGSWRIVRSPERLQVLYRPSAADKVSAEAGLLTCKVLAAAASKDGQNKFSRMMFAGTSEKSGAPGHRLRPYIRLVIISRHVPLACRPISREHFRAD
jgi:hypothetical protein